MRDTDTDLSATDRQDLPRPEGLKRRALLGGVAAAAAVAALPRPLLAAPGTSQSGSAVDVLLIGGGVMSATLGVLLHELEPGWSMTMLERLDEVALESSNGWNNAGTGHSALAELNYTPETSTGAIQIGKAVEINEAFQVSRQFWAHQVEQGVLKNPRSFINSTPHMSFVWGEENMRYLEKRHAALQGSPLFAGMQFSRDPKQIAEWVPLMMEGRDAGQAVAATWAPQGTDVNFGEITRQYVAHLKTQANFTLQTSSEVRDITRNADGTWRVTYRNLKDGSDGHVVDARFLFLGAGGGALHLLQMSGIPEGDDFGGFPVGGSFLVCDNPAVAQRHLAKAYGKASVGSPPMSVPHLDTRMLDGKQVVLFGPFATFSTKFLKQGSLFDLPASVTLENIGPMLRVGWDEFDLVQYLAGQLMMSDEDRLAALREYFPQAAAADWRLWQAGQRVQIIKRDPQKGGALRLGTEIVNARDNSIAALLGASPGASTAAPIMLDLVKRVFPERVATAAWQEKLRRIVPSFGTALNGDPQRVAATWASTGEKLQLAIAAPAIPSALPSGPGPADVPAGEVRRVPDMAL
ncbi:malate dehydrogenase (quinone) [Teichococcus deserti]|uniref:malate dehydrogenase (quinone) n=1 Tax=Teichococcus deserti TaxID=1817963 RepID=UPI0009FAAA52|nr:malate dehydrogenase (quinone) [Pseudoroseomonas deserti]